MNRAPSEPALSEAEGGATGRDEVAFHESHHARAGFAVRIRFNCNLSSLTHNGTTQHAQASVIPRSPAVFKCDVGP
jgi:hypothetical protein